MVFLLLLKHRVQYSGAKDGLEDCITPQSARRAKPLNGVDLRFNKPRPGTPRGERLEPGKDQGDLRGLPAIANLKCRSIDLLTTLT